MGRLNFKKAVLPALTVLFSLLWCGSLFLPLGQRVRAGEERYRVALREGGETQVNFASAYGAFVGATETGTLLLDGENLAGEITPSQAYAEIGRTLTEGNLNELLALNAAALPRLERVALWRAFSDCVWYAGEAFAYTGDGVSRASSASGDKLVLLEGSIAASRLIAFGTKVLELRPAAEIAAKSLVNTGVEKFVAFAPYEEDGGALYLDTAGGKRLVAGVPSALSLRIHDNYFADTGALLPCKKLVRLEVPFAGTASSAAGENYRGELAELFRNGGEYEVPASFKTVRVRGGLIGATAFYGCGGLREIDLCGVAAENISVSAFEGCGELVRLHTPRASVNLPGEYESRVLSCGCTLYERTAGK